MPVAIDAKVYGRVHLVASTLVDFGRRTFEMKDGNIVAATITTGTGNGQADTVFADQRTLAASANEDLDLSGALVDPLGAAAGFAEVCAIEIRAAAGNTNNVVVGGAGSNAFIGPFGANTHTIAIPPGGCLVLHHPGAGWAVTAGTGDLLRIANGGSGTGVTYDIVVLGRSA